MKRADEELCRMQFDAFLRKNFPPSEITWLEVAQQDEPPDYYLNLSGERFAVEVTTLLEKVSVGTTSPLPPFVIIRLLECFVKDVEAIARAESALHGKYLVTFFTPIDNFSSVRAEIQKGLLDYIRNTRGDETSSMAIVFERVIPGQRTQKCGIQKVDNKRDKVHSGGPVWTKWEGEATVGLCHLLNDSFNIKIDKLGDIVFPKFLLLLDEYVFADLEMYEECISRVSSLDFFHTVFVVQDGKRGFVFHSQCSDWSQHRTL